MLQLAASPELFPLDIQPSTDAVALIALSHVDYEKASFLDSRLERPLAATPGFVELANAAAGQAVACDFIFHIGHVGSTLMSRVLGAHPRIFSLREPLALRTFAQARPGSGAGWSHDAWRSRLAVFLALYSRTWLPGQRSLIKATSLVSEIAGAMLDLSPGSRALMMTVRPETYLATILGGPNSRIELAVASAGRVERLNRRLGTQAIKLEGLSEGELAALSWACEMTALAEAERQHRGRVVWIDFDAFLARPAEGLSDALVALHGAADPEQVRSLAASAYFDRYSKAPEYGYGADVRRQVLDAARQEFAAEIDRGLAWLDELAARHPAVAVVSKPAASS